MRNFLLLCLLAASCQAGVSQISDRSIGFDYLNHPAGLVRNAANQWLVAGTTAPLPGAYGQYNFFFAQFTDDGIVATRGAMPLAFGEIYRIGAVVPLADGGFVFAYDPAQCDVGSHLRRIRRIDAAGQLQWDFDTAPFAGAPGLAGIELTPDGQLLGWNHQQLRKFDLEWGGEVWSGPINSAVQYDIRDLHFVSANGDFIAVGNPKIQFWKNTGTPSAPVYTLEHAETLPNIPPATFSSVQKIATAFDGQLLTFDRQGNRFYTIDSTGHAAFAGMVVNFSDSDFAGDSTGVYVLGRTGSQNILLRFPTLGAAPDTLPLPLDAQLIPEFVDVHDGTVAVCGTEFNGPNLDPAHPSTFYQGAATNVWLRVLRPPYDPAIPGPSAALEDVEQQAALIQIYQQWGNGQTLVSLNGGDFRLKIRNVGAGVLDTITVGIHFEHDLGFPICFRTPARSRFFTGLNLLPGDTAWLHFGNILANRQEVLPTELCFFIYAPNERPDPERFDDIFCTPILSTGIAEPAQTLQLSPNPTHDYFTVEAAGTALPGNFRLFDAMGQLVREGTIPPGSQSFTSRALGLPDGVYVLAIGNWRKRLVVLAR